MNLFETCTVLALVCGAMGGGGALKNSGALTVASGMVVGLLVGVGVVALTRYLLGVLAKRDRPQILERHQTAGLLLAVFGIPLALPVLSLLLSHFIVSAGLHL